MSEETDNLYIQNFREIAFYKQNLNKAHTIFIEMQPKHKDDNNNPLIVVDELELAIFKKHIMLALNEIQKTKE